MGTKFASSAEFLSIYQTACIDSAQGKHTYAQGIAKAGLSKSQIRGPVGVTVSYKNADQSVDLIYGEHIDHATGAPYTICMMFGYVSDVEQFPALAEKALVQPFGSAAMATRQTLPKGAVSYSLRTKTGNARLAARTGSSVGHGNANLLLNVSHR